MGRSSHLELMKSYHKASELNETALGDLISTLHDLDMRRCSIEADLEATRSILAMVRCRNETLMTSEKAIARDLSRKLQILSAHRRFSSAIWGEIFAFMVVEAEEQFRHGSRVGTPPFSALTLSAVCHSWRQTAFLHPELWRHIAICSSQNQHTEARIGHYLLRIRDELSPIVYTYSKINSHWPRQALWFRVSQRLCRLKPKLKLLDIALDIPFMIPKAFLSSLDVDTEELLLRKQSGESTIPILVHKHGIHNLKTITCHRIQLHSEDGLSPDHAPLPSPNNQSKLEAIAFINSELQYNTLVDFCKELPNLAHLDIRMSHLIHENPQVSVADVTFRALRKLSLQSTQLPAFSSELLVPNLEEVDLTCRSYAVLDWNEFIAVGSRSQALRVLTLRARIDEVTSESLDNLRMTYESILLSRPKLGCLHIYGDSGGDLPLTAKGLLRLGRLVLHHSDADETVLADLLMEAYQNRQEPISLTFDHCRRIASPHAGYLARLKPNSEDNEDDGPYQDFSSISDPNKRHNRRPTGVERQNLTNWAKRDQEELNRISKEINLNSEEIESCLVSIRHYEEALRIAKVMKACTESKIEVVKQVIESIQATLDDNLLIPPIDEKQASLVLRDMITKQKDITSASELELKNLESTWTMLTEKIGRLEDDAEAARSILATIRRRNEALEVIRTAVTQDLSPKLELLSARRQIPDEIWGDIFLSRVVDDERDFDERQRRIGLPPFTALKLSAVCQHWRRIVASQPELWRFIALLNENAPLNEARLQHFLSRLGNVAPRAYTYVRKEGARHGWGKLSNTLQQISKFHSLDIIIDTPQPMPRIFLVDLEVETNELCLRKCAQGQEAILMYRRRIQPARSIWCHRIQLTLESNFAPDTEASYAEQDLELESLAFTECALELDPLFNLCEQAPHLRHLDIRKSLIVRSDMAGQGMTFSSLTKLSLRSCSLAVFKHQSLLPSLEEVDLTCMENSIQDWRDFVSIGQRTGTIQIITLRNESATRKDLSLREVYQAIITTLSNVKHLTLHPSSSPDDGQFCLSGLALARVNNLNLIGSEVTEETLTNALQEAYLIRQQRIYMTFDGCKNVDSPTAGRLRNLEPMIEEFH
ncbi:hypothetical protein FRC17_003511 [Serendipita sp. 399]|nr:hypothetical protein FRC17_003511 [Serendipita sp. 399]